jgi:tetratricopeptide (TPR) repeat protein
VRAAGATAPEIVADGKGAGGPVLSEEALIVLAALAAVGLLVLGVLELLWPTRPRHPVRRPPPVSVRVPRPHRTSALVRHAREPGQPGYARRTPAVAAAGAAWLVSPPGDVEVLTGEPTTGSLAEACFALHLEGRHDEAIERARVALAGAADLHDAAALWSVVAAARRSLGDDEAAATALEAAIAAAPERERPAYQRQLATLAGDVARDLLAEADRYPRHDSEECLTALRGASTWLERGAAAMPDDAALAELAASTRATLWTAWERTVMAHVQQQDFRAARRLLREALADPRVPPGRAETFRTLFSGTFSGELGQLTARAIRSVQDAREADALAALERAERLLSSLSDDALGPRRREEVDRRLWWGYRTLGERRLTVGECEAALEPLFHALGYDVGPERHQETRALLGRALAGVIDARALAVRQLAEGGDTEAAVVQRDALWTLLRSATEMGLTEEELAGPFQQVQRLLETTRRDRPRPKGPRRRRAQPARE